MALNGSSAVHQLVHPGQGGPLVLSSPSDLSGVPAEALPLAGTCDLLVEQFERVRDMAELSNQLRLAHLVQPNHGAAGPTGTGRPLLSQGAELPIISKDADQVRRDDQ